MTERGVRHPLKVAVRREQLELIVYFVPPYEETVRAAKMRSGAGIKRPTPDARRLTTDEMIRTNHWPAVALGSYGIRSVRQQITHTERATAALPHSLQAVFHSKSHEPSAVI